MMLFSSRGWSFAIGLNAAARLPERQLGSNGDQLYRISMCLCLLFLYISKNWWEGFICPLHLPPTPLPAQPCRDPCFPPLSLSWALSGLFSDAIKQKGKFLIARTHPLERFQLEKSPLRKVRAVAGGLSARSEENGKLRRKK